ncbi:MAG: ABC transporter permease subunit [Oscillospiraceae bacterium]
MTHKAKKSKLSNHGQLFVISLPAILSILAFAYLPMFGLFIAFKDINYQKGIFGSDWVGFKNFDFFFKSQDAFRITRNTILYNVVFIVLGLSMAVIVAMLLYSMSRKAIKFYQTVLFFPYFLSWVIVGYLSYIFLSPTSGVLNQLVAMFGGESLNWYAESKYWPFILVFFNIWKNLGYNAIIFYTGLMSIDSSLYEAASIDGANSFQQKIHITLPLIKSLVIIMVILAVGKIMCADFGMFYFIPRDTGSIYAATDVIDTYVYRALRVTGELGMSAAASFYQSVVGCVLVVATNLIIKKVSPDDAIF